MKVVEVKESRNGLGVFAKRKFSIGSKILEVKGTIISCDEDEDVDEKVRDNAFRYDEDNYLSPAGRMGDYLNHSCSPNCGVVKKEDKIFIFAVKNIKEGDEVTFDYSTILASDDSWKMKCNCGDSNCRKVIKRFDSLPAQLKRQYIGLNMVPDYIMR